MTDVQLQLLIDAINNNNIDFDLLITKLTVITDFIQSDVFINLMSYFNWSLHFLVYYLFYKMLRNIFSTKKGDVRLR